MTADDRRKSYRIDAHDEGLRVMNAVDGESIGIVSNLSLGGMMVITHRELQPNGILQLKVAVPTALGGDPIPLGVRILWCTPANTPSEHWVGMETIDIGRDDRAALERLLDYLQHQS